MNPANPDRPPRRDPGAPKIDDHDRLTDEELETARERLRRHSPARR